MAYPKNNNEIYQKILELTYNFYISRKNFSNTQYTKLYLEFNNSQIDIGNTHPDPNGIFTGSAFELVQRGYLNLVIITRAGISNFAFKITNEGINLFENKENLEKEFPTAKGNFAFVIMSFSDNKMLNDCYELAIKPVVKECGFECIRVDEIEHNRRITDKVIECILHAKFIIADLTEQRPNCYYELGFSHAHGKDVIHIIHEKEPIHFDIKDYNFIVYPSVSELKVRLKDRIINTIKKQPSNL